MCILYDNSRSNLNIIAPNHNAFRFVSETEMYYLFIWVLATLAFCTIKSRRTNTDVVSINNNTLAVIIARVAATLADDHNPKSTHFRRMITNQNVLIFR
jgi:hypothetical protein